MKTRHSCLGSFHRRTECAKEMESLIQMAKFHYAAQILRKTQKLTDLDVRNNKKRVKKAKFQVMSSVVNM